MNGSRGEISRMLTGSMDGSPWSFADIVEGRPSSRDLLQLEQIRNAST